MPPRRLSPSALRNARRRARLRLTAGACLQAESAFSTLPRCLWFATVSIVTVGYGDMVPATAAGRCVSVLAMLAGTLVIALPVTVVGSTFNTVFHSMAAREPAVAEMQEAAEVTCVTHAHGGSAARSPLASSYAEAAPARLRHRIRLAGDAQSSSGVSRSERPRGRRRLASWEMRRGSPPRGAAASRTPSRRPMAGTLGSPLASMMHTLSSHSEPEFAVCLQRCFGASFLQTRLELARMPSQPQRSNNGGHTVLG